MPGGIFGNPAERFHQQGGACLFRQAEMHGRAIRLAHRTDGLANLRGVAQHEVGRHLRDSVVGPEHGFQVDTQVVAEPRFKLAHDGDIGSAEPVDGLPVVADGEELGVGCTVQQRLEQPRPRREISWNSSTMMYPNGLR